MARIVRQPIVYRASWPDQQIIRGMLSTIQTGLSAEIERTALILVGPALAGEGFDESCLYAPDYDRRFRPQSARQGSKDDTATRPVDICTKFRQAKQR